MKVLFAIVLILPLTSWAGSLISEDRKCLTEMEIQLPSGKSVYPTVGMELKPISTPWQIRAVPSNEANEFLKKHPEWEPFGVVHSGGRVLMETSRSGLTQYPVWISEGLIYLKRKVQP